MDMAWDLNLPFDLGCFPCGNCGVSSDGRSGREREMKLYSKENRPLVVELCVCEVVLTSTCDGLMLFFFGSFMDFKCDTYRPWIN